MRLVPLLVHLLLPLGLLGAQVPVDESRYQVILDRAMFGRPVPAAPAAPPPTRAAAVVPSWAQDFRVTMMTLEEDTKQVRVGLQNVKDNSGFLLLLGDKNTAGYELVRADFNRGEATVAWNGDAKVFTLETGPVSSPVANEPGDQGNMVRSVSARSTRSRTAPQPVPVRVVAEPTPVPESAFQTQEELDAHLKNYQMEVLRQGLPPLPVPLTPEMDQQLVNEGVLPPQ
jgi:hypothetical protein